MRKNTLIKLLAVLVMCFLVGAALVSCGEGETEETVKTVVGVQFVGDDLVITYSDGTKTTTAIPAAAECKHEGANQYSLVDHGVRSENDADFAEKGKFVNGVILNVCNDCCSAWTEDGVLHVGYATETVPATCTAKACVARVCEIPGCGERFDKKEVGELADHVLSTVVTGDNCLGGEKTTTCANCDYKVVEEIPESTEVEDFAGKHTVADWTITKAPTFDAKGTIEGQCTVCSKTLTEELLTAVKMKDSNGYTYNKSASTEITVCGMSGVYAYTHDATGETFTVTVPYTENVVKHTLNGQLMISADMVPAGKELDMAYDVDTDGIKTFANKTVTCYAAVEAHFCCTAKHDTGETCGKDIMIYVKEAHTYGDWVKVDANAIECAGETQYVRTCTVAECGAKDYKMFPKVDCEPEYTNTLYTANDGTDVVFDASLEANIGKTPFYKGVCKHCKDVTYKAVTEYAYAEVTPATCQANGLGKVTYKKATDGNTVTVDVVLAQFAHKITVNGETEYIKSSDASDFIYYADDARYADLIIITNDQKADFEAGKKVVGYMQCDCTCDNCRAHDVTVWVMKNAPLA